MFAEFARWKSQSALEQKPAPSEFLLTGSFSSKFTPVVDPSIDPHSPVAAELSHIRLSLLNLLVSTHPSLREITDHYLLQTSQLFRSLIVLLVSRATNGLGVHWEQKYWEAESEGTACRTAELNAPLMHSEVLNNPHPAMPIQLSSFRCVFKLQRPADPADSPLRLSPSLQNVTVEFVPPSPLILPTQLRLAQIAEMIHIASVLHDHVPDSINSPESSLKIGNKFSILGGDFLLARASTALARLGENEAVELIAGVISNVVEGEVLKMQGYNHHNPFPGPLTLEEAWDTYLRKTYLKSASLIAKSARAATILGGSGETERWKDIVYAFGRNLGMAYQLAQDVIEFEAGGKGSDLGVVIGPHLFATEQYPELRKIINRNFSVNGDIELATDYVSRSSGVERSRCLVRTYAEKAREILQLFPDSETKNILETITITI